MVEPQRDERATEAPAGRASIEDPGPKRGRTCYVHRHDRVKIKVEVGFGISATVDVCPKNFNFNGATADPDKVDKIRSAVKACLVILVGGHHVVVSDIEAPRSGVYPVRLYVRCKGAPEDLDTIEFSGKQWLDVGSYFTRLHHQNRLDPQVVKHDIATWKG